MSTWYERCEGRELAVCELCKRHMDHEPKVVKYEAHFPPIWSQTGGTCADAMIPNSFAGSASPKADA